MPVVKLSDYRKPIVTEPLPVYSPRSKHAIRLTGLRVGESFYVHKSLAGSVRVMITNYKRFEPRKQFITWMVGERMHVRRLSNVRGGK